MTQERPQEKITARITMDSSLPAVTVFHLHLLMSSDGPEEPQGVTLVSNPTHHTKAQPYQASPYEAFHTKDIPVPVDTQFRTQQL